MNSTTLRDDLLDVFQKHGVDVAVGLTKGGVALRSQDERVDLLNLGKVTAFKTFAHKPSTKMCGKRRIAHLKNTGWVHEDDGTPCGH